MKGNIERPKPPLVDNTLLCAKKREKGQFLIWAVITPDMQAKAATLQQAEERLVEEMWKRYDLDEPFAVKYQEGPLVAAKSDDVLLKVVPNEVADAFDPERYFMKGFCPVCQSGQGGRNAELLEVERLPKTVKSGFLVRFQPYLKCGMRVGMPLLHTRICEELKRVCDPLLQFREVRVKPNRNCDFCEILPCRMIPEEVPTAREGTSGGVCVRCGARFIYAKISRQHSGLFIAEENAQLIRRHGMAAIGYKSRRAICMSSTVWKAISRLEHAKGLLASEVGQLAREAMNPKPKFEKIAAFKI
jgi:hypothetical protein